MMVAGTKYRFDEEAPAQSTMEVREPRGDRNEPIAAEDEDRIAVALMTVEANRSDGNLHDQAAA